MARDDYIAELCDEYPDLKELYGIDKNKGYGTAKHMIGIREFGITKWHRKSYGPCKGVSLRNEIMSKTLYEMQWTLDTTNNPQIPVEEENWGLNDILGNVIMP